MHSLDATVTLNNGVKMPLFGLGVYLANQGKETEQAVQWALETGYRHIDTAQIYRNERSVGKGIQASGVPRRDIFITTKVWRDVRPQEVISSLETSLDLLQINRLDLLLFHWPKRETRKEVWKEMTKAYDMGLTRAIGVSNFTRPHLEELLQQTDVIPAVNQMEHNVFMNNKDLVEYCKENNIQYEAYSPLAKAQRLDHPRLNELASKYNKSVAQLMIRWVLEHDIVVIPKSTNKQRIQQNADVFDFTLEDADRLEMNSWNENLVTGWNPYTYP